MRQALLVAVFAGVMVVAATASASPTHALVQTAFNKELKATIVVDGSGRTLYMFTADPKDTSVCAGADPACPRLWPYFTSTGRPKAGKGIVASLLGTIKTGAVLQVTYNHHPLYYFHGGSPVGTGDRKAGDVRGENFLSTWFVLSPKGRPIK